MIVSIGLPDRNSLAFKLAEKLAEFNSLVCFLAPFNNSEIHIELLNELVSKCIMFDPIFCNNEGKLSDFTYNKLKQAFDVNTDIKTVCVDPVCLTDISVIDSIKKVVSRKKAKLILLDNETDIEELARLLVCS